MPTPALTVRRLAEMMRHYAATAFDVSLRYSGDTDAVLLGKLTMLDVIADGQWTSGEMASGEEVDLKAASSELARAWSYLKDRVEDPPVEIIFEHGTAPAGLPVLRAKSLRRVSRIGSHV